MPKPEHWHDKGLLGSQEGRGHPARGEGSVWKGPGRPQHLSLVSEVDCKNERRPGGVGV